jgi:cobalamin synthase
MCWILNGLCYIWVLIHTKTKNTMKDSKVGMYFLGMIVSSVGMLIHLFKMIDTSKGIHLVCTLLWMVILTCLVLILKKELHKG